jgi:hypothetical protein
MGEAFFHVLYENHEALFLGTNRCDHQGQN